MAANNPTTIEYREKRPTPPLELSLLIILAVLTGGMAFLAVSALMPETGAAATIKSGIIAVMAGGVVFAVNHYAIRYGAWQAATGYALAAVFSVGTIIIVGAGLFASTYAGMTLTSVNELKLQTYVSADAEYVSKRIARVSQATRTLPVVRAIAADLRAKVECEIQKACLSGRGRGEGPVTRALENLAARAEKIVSELLNGNSQRRSLIKSLNELTAELQGILNQSDFSLQTKRQAMASLVAKTDQALSELDEIVPIALLSAYSQELQSGIDIPSRLTATKTVNGILRNHGRALSSVLDTIENGEVVRPDFPSEAGVSSTFDHIGHFLPIAAIVAVVELILPLTLWVYTYLGIVWEKEMITRSARSASSNRNIKPKQAGNKTFKSENVASLNKHRARRSVRHKRHVTGQGEV